MFLLDCDATEDRLLVLPYVVNVALFGSIVAVLWKPYCLMGKKMNRKNRRIY